MVSTKHSKFMVRYCNNLSFNLLFLVCCVVFLLYILCCLCVCVYNNFKISFVVDKGLFPLKTSIPHPKPKTRRLQQRRVSQSTKKNIRPSIVYNPNVHSVISRFKKIFDSKQVSKSKREKVKSTKSCLITTAAVSSTQRSTVMISMSTGM